MVRTQIQLTEAQSQALKQLATQRGLSMAEIIRRGLDFYLRIYGTLSPEERRQRAISAVGRFRSGQTDLSKSHDEYLAEAYAQ